MPASAPSSGLPIGRLRGVPVYLGRSWFVIAVVIVLLFGPQVRHVLPELGVAAYAVSLAYTVLLLISVLAHEAAHSLAAQARGYDVEEIVADLWGGHTSYRAVDGTPASTAFVAVVGPLSNLVLAGLGWLVLTSSDGDLVRLLSVAFVWANAFVGVFNLLPGLPLDGGYLVDALVWRITGSRAAGMRAAGHSGRVVAVLVAGWLVARPLLSGDRLSPTTTIWGLLICGFLWQGASAAIGAGSELDVLGAVRVHDVLRPVALVPADTQLGLLDVRDSVTVDGRGSLIGYASMEAIRRGRQEAPTAPVSAVTLVRPAGWVVQAEPGDDVSELVEAVNSTPQHVEDLLVVGSNGVPLGITRVSDLDDALRRAQQSRRGRP